MIAVVSVWRAHRRRSRRGVLAAALTIGLLGGIALTAFAGARQTASTFAAYERDVRLSDLAVNSFPDLQRVRAIARLPGVASSATYLGMDAYPVLGGRVVRDFRYTGVFGSLDGRFLTQDRATVIHGRLPHENATHELALSPRLAIRFGAGVGDEVKYRFEKDSKVVGETVFRVVGIVRLPPVIVDENDIIEGAVLPPAATRAHLSSFYYAWQGLRLVDGVKGIPRFLDSLRADTAAKGLPLITQRYDETRVLAQRSIRPQAVALALFGAAAMIAAIALGGLALSRLVRRWTDERQALRAMGLTRRQLALVFGFDTLVAVAIGIGLAVIVAIAGSPLWPVGTLRAIAPDTGIRADLTVILGAGGAFALALLGVSAVAAWRGAGAPAARAGRARRSTVAERARRSSVPLPGTLGAHFAFDRGPAPQSVPVRATWLAGTAATIAVVAALVFGASIQALVSHPDRYGWTWDRMVIAQAGYGTLQPAVIQPLVERERAIAGWSLLTFETITIDGVPTPAIGVDQRRGHVVPPVLHGRAVAGDHEIALGSNTLEKLGRKIGDRVRVNAAGHTAAFTVVGTITLPSIGLGGADHTSLGRGALLTFGALADLVSPGVACGASDAALCPRAVVFDLVPGSDGNGVVRRIAAANPDGTPGGTYEQPITRAADIRNYDEMGSFPVALAALLATAAAVAFVAMLLTSVRARRRELAVLKSLGLTNGQLRVALTAQSLLTVLTTLVVGLPLGILAGRVTWVRFARDAGVIARPAVPLLTMVAIAAAAAVVCGLFALIPAAIAARARTAQVLRTE
jgi:putative ABC transport system permease protein